MKARDIMADNLITVGPKTTIQEIAKILVENRISGVPVVGTDGKLLGIVSEGDLLHKEVVPRIPDALNILGAIVYYHGLKQYNEDFRKMIAFSAEEIMTKKVIVVDEDVDISEVGKLMIEHHIKRIPVVKAGNLVGMISRTDMIRTLIE
jgi:CBS domain-containing protein